MTGILIADGVGAPENDFMALRWLRKAAKQGHASAFLLSVKCMKRVRNRRESQSQAFVWFAAASELGNTQAESHLDLLASNLESELLTQAETLAQICIASVFQTCE